MLTLASSSIQHEQVLRKHKTLAASIHHTEIIRGNKYTESLISKNPDDSLILIRFFHITYTVSINFTL